MSLPFDSEQFAHLRRDARLSMERMRRQEDQLSRMVASAEGHVRHVEAALSRADRAEAGSIRLLLSAQLERGAADTATLRRLCVSAREQHVAARQWLIDLGGDPAAGDEYPSAVLVVDDYADIRDLLAHVLQKAGFIVRTAANGLEALIAAYEMRPGVIVMDVSMPVLDGIEAARLIKAGEVTRDARIIAHTGTPPSETRAAHTMFAAVLQKPVSADVVLATVQRVAGL